MIKIGMALSSEEFSASELIENAQLAENSGFDFCFISDHYHPWVDNQGHSPFVWTTLGGISQATNHITLGTGVTCPIIRIHPAIIAQASATTASLFENRFILGLGTGENLNEHVVGLGWPTISHRQAMLVEAVEIIRLLWTGENINYVGEFFDVEDARLYSIPKILPPIYIAASGPKSAQIAGQIADGLIVASPDKKVIDSFRSSGGEGKPIVAQMTVCYATSRDQAVSIIINKWPNVKVPGQLSQELRTPVYFEQLVEDITASEVQNSLALGPDPDIYIQAVEDYIKAGVTHLYFHQIGPHQNSFINFFRKDIKDNLPT